MTSEECVKTCCVFKCINTPSNSKVKFFSFPEHRSRSYQRNKWVQAIKNANGHYWMTNEYSVVCGAHFIKGHPCIYPQDPDYAPSVFSNEKKPESIKPSTVSVKKFGLEYIKHGALLGKSHRSNANIRNLAYENLALAFGIPVTTVRNWERRFKDYFEQKMAEPPDKRKPSADGTPHWLTTVAKRLHPNQTNRLAARSGGGPVSPDGVVAALCAAARARGSLCATALYNDVRRELRLTTAISALHAIWVSAQRVSLQQVVVAGRAGDAGPAGPPPAAATVADLVLLHTDVDILTDESVTLYEESAALHTLWQLIQRHRLEDAAPARSRVRAQRWTRAHRSYIESGRTVSLVVLQRRWYELKLQARVRLAMHWRRPPGPQLCDELPAAPRPAPDPAPTPHEAYPRPAPLHIAILKRYPHIATGQFASWRQQVLDGTIVTELLDVENDVKESQSNDNEQSTTTIDTGNESAAKQLYPNLSKVEQPTYDVPMVEQHPDNDPLIEQPADTDLLEEENDVKVRSNVSQQSTDIADADDDAAAKQLYPNMSKVEEPENGQTFYNVPLVKQSAADDQLSEHTTDNNPLAKEPTIHKLKIEQPIDSGSLADNYVAEQTADNDLLVEQRTVDHPLPEHTTDNDPLAKEPTIHKLKIEQPIDSGSLADNHVAEQTADNDLLVEQRTVDDPLPEQTTVIVPKVERAMNYHLLINPSGVRTLAECPVGHAGNAATEDILSMLNTPDTQGGPDVANEQIRRAMDKSNEVIPPQRAYSYDTDTDTEDNLVIDECSHQTPCSQKLEPVPHTETHSFDTLSPDVALRNSTPTIEVLHMIDPDTVKTEILFESDEDDFGPRNVVDKDKIELDTKKEVSFISNRIMFVDEEPMVSVCDVKSEDDVTGRVDCEDAQKMDVAVNDTQTIDPKLLMDTQVRLFRIDEIPPWMKNVRKDNSIRVSRIHRRYYTPNPKNVRKKRTKNTRLDVELRTSARLTPATAKPQEIRVDKFCLDKIAKTHSIRQLCSNIKRELIDEQLKLLEDDPPKKKARIESDSDDEKPLLVLREGKPPRETTNETELSQATVVRQMVDEMSSDEELMDDEMFGKLRGEERKRGGRATYYAASTIEWSAAFAPALGRVAKRVSLPDLESVRRYNSGMQVAQVAPITSTVGPDGDDARQAGQPPDDTAADDTSEAWSALDLPADDELQAALDGLTTAPAEAAQKGSHCCAARRHREVNDSRRRIGLDEIPLHNHPDGVCTCCCAHLSDADARHRLDHQLRVLHQDIEKMLQKSVGGKILPKLAVKHSRSPSPARASTSATTATAATSAHKQATKDAPSNTATVAKVPKAKPPKAKPPKAKPATYTNRSKKSRTRARAGPPPAPSPPAPPVNDFEEWQRQKSMNAKYFHINSNVSFKKDKSTTAQDTLEQSTTAQDTLEQSPTAQGRDVESTTAQATAVQSPIAQGRAAQSTTLQRTAVQSPTAQAPAVQSPTAQSRAVQSPTAQSRAVQSPTAQTPAVQSPTAQSRAVQSPTAQSRAVQSPTAQDPAVQSPIAQDVTPPQNVVQPGLMPYIRQSRLLSPQEEPGGRRAKPGPLRHRLNLVAIAPKPDTRRDTGQTQHNTVVNELNEVTKNLTIRNYQSQSASPRRMNLIAEQVSEPTLPVQVSRINSVPTDKPVSILEEYSRTLTIEPVNNTPVVNALSLRVPSGPAGPKTTIVMALTLPSDEVIQQTINRLYANDTVDLTEEPQTTEADIKKTTAPALVAAMKSFMKPGNKKKSPRSLLKPVTGTKSPTSLLKTKITSALDGLQDITDPLATKHKGPKIMSLSTKLHEDDVIEIEDTDSNHSNSSVGNRSENYILINKSSNPTVYANKGSNQAGSATESSDQSTSKPDESSNQAASNGGEAVSETNESASEAGTTNNTNHAVDEDISSKKPNETKKSRRHRIRSTKPPVYNRTNVSEEAVSSHSVVRPCSRIPVLTSLMDCSRRCPARFANVAAMTDFMAKLRRAAAQADKEVYCHKWSPVEQPVSALPCGETLLCVDGSRPPLVLPARDERLRRERATPNARAHFVLTDADPPCALPTYWTLSAFGQMARVLPDELVNTDVSDAAEAEPRVRHVRYAGGARSCAARGLWATPKEDRKICEKNHNFKILTAFCSADGIREAARAGASLLLLSVRRARVVVLTLRRDVRDGVVRHRASADVEGDLLRELEGLLDEAEVDEQLGGRADIIGNEEPAGKCLDQ